MLDSGDTGGRSRQACTALVLLDGACFGEEVEFDMLGCIREKLMTPECTHRVRSHTDD